MLYINKEYGFDGKPPYFKEFYEEATKGQLIKKVDFPVKQISGIGLDYKNSCGAMLVHCNGAIFGVRVSVFDHDEWIDGNDFLTSKYGRILAATKDNSFFALKYKTVTIKFSVLDNREIIFSVESQKKATVRVIFYPVYYTKAKFKINGNHTIATSDGIASIAGEVKFNEKDIYEAHGRFHVYNASKAIAKFSGEVYTDADLTDNGVFGETIYEFNLTKVKNAVYGHAYLDDETFNSQIKTVNDCICNLNNKEVLFSHNCLMGSGSLAKNATLVGRNVLMNLIYEPYLKQIIATSNRTRINEHFAMHKFSDALTVLLAGNFFGYEDIYEQCKILISEHATGGMILLMLYKQGLDSERLKNLYNIATKEFILTNVLETENDKASEVFSVWKTCLKIFNLEVLELISKAIDKEHTSKYTKLISDLKSLVNRELYSETYKTYLNKTLEGEFIETTTSRKFYVLLAGVVETEKLDGVIADLTNPKTFLSDYGVLEFSKQAKKRERVVDAYTNFLIYNGLMRYNLFNECALLASKTCKLWDEINLKGIPFSLDYNVSMGVKAEGGFNIASNFLGLIGIDEVLSFDLFKLSAEKTLSFGSVRGGQLILNYVNNNHNYDLKQTEKDTMLVIDGVQVFKIDDATTTISGFMETKTGCEFITNAARTPRIELTLPLVAAPGKKQYKLAFVLPAGINRVKIDGAKVNVKPL